MFDDLCVDQIIKRLMTVGVRSISAITLICISTYGQTLPDRVDALFAKSNHKDQPGTAVMLIRDGRVEYRKGFGLADLDARTPITPDTQFSLESVTKQFTAMAILILMDQGKLKLDDTLAKFCPEFPGYARAITIRQLLNHTSGLPDGDALIGDEDDQDKNPRAAHEFTAAEALQALSRQQKPDFPSGLVYVYSNSGYLVLGQIIERVSGQRYADFLKEAIFDPLGMQDTLVVDERHQKTEHLALGYDKTSGQWRDVTYSPWNSIYGMRGVVSTVNDLYKWDQALYTERLVRRSTLELAFTPGRTNNGNEIMETHMTDLLKRPCSYGFGWVISSLDGDKVVEHSGRGIGYSSYIMRVPSRGLTAILLSNSFNADSPEIARQMIEIARR